MHFQVPSGKHFILHPITNIYVHTVLSQFPADQVQLLKQIRTAGITREKALFHPPVMKWNMIHSMSSVYPTVLFQSIPRINCQLGTDDSS